MATEVERQAAYQAAQQAAVFFVQAGAGYLRISGPDRRTFLQRQMTNNVDLLSAGGALLTVLTSPAARILDVLYLTQEAEAIGAIALSGRSEHTARYLKSRIFFMDNVSVEDASQEVVQVDLFGPEAKTILERLGLASALETNQLAAVHVAGADIPVLAMEPAIGLGYRFITPAAVGPALQEALLDAGAVQLEEDTFDVLRVEAGVPSGEQELTETYTPLETGLRVAVSDNKGCYTGQEVIARQITYDKVTQLLCGLRLAGEAEPGARVLADGKPAGKLTSYALSPRLGHIGLAVLKRPHFEPGSEVQVSSSDAGPVPAQVTSLPFESG